MKRKAIALLLVALMLLTMAACAKEEESTAPSVAASKPAEAANAGTTTEANTAKTDATQAEAGKTDAAEAESGPIAEYPALVTSGGQSADYQMIGTLMTKLNMDFTTNNLATSQDLGDAKTLIVVVGGSSKGLGAAGIDANGELARLDELINGAKAAGLKIIAMHTGGESRRGDLSDKFITPIFEKADYAIVVASGDKDGMMAGICDKNNIPIVVINSISEVATALPAVFK